jgi:hypothetical protein
MKRGRKPIPAHLKAVVKMQIRVTTAMADGMYVLAQRRRTDVSKITRQFYEALIAREFKTDRKYGSAHIH